MKDGYRNRGSLLPIGLEAVEFGQDFGSGDGFSLGYGEEQENYVFVVCSNPSNDPSIYRGGGSGTCLQFRNSGAL